jgi:hypothetical protein
MAATASARERLWLFSEFYGAGSDAFCSAPAVVHSSSAINGFLERVPLEQLTQQLADAVQSSDLADNLASFLGTPLTRVRKLLADGNAGNNSDACAPLASFVTRVDVLERRGELTAAQASELRALAANLQSVLGCN